MCYNSRIVSTADFNEQDAQHTKESSFDVALALFRTLSSNVADSPVHDFRVGMLAIHNELAPSSASSRQISLAVKSKGFESVLQTAEEQYPVRQCS